MPIDRFLDARIDMSVVKELGEVRDTLAERLRKAYEVAGRYGRVVGSVSRWDKANVDSDRAVVTFTVDPGEYYRDIVEGREDSPLYRTGSVLAIVDPKTLHLVSVRVVSIERPDQLAEARVGLLHYPSGPDPEALVTRTIVHAEMLLEWDPVSGDAVPANLAIEPQSPVIDPETRYVPALLGLPEDGVVLGALANNGVPVKDGGVPVRLPWNTLLQHVLVLGTTGSGKTTLLKNMIAYTVKEGAGIPVVMDLNRDYVQLLYPRLGAPRQGSREWLVDNGVYRGVVEPDAMIVVAPVPRPLWGSVMESRAWSIEDALLELFNMYYDTVLAPVAEASGVDGLAGDPVVRLDGVARVVAFHRAPGRTKTIVFVPYALRSTSISSNVMFSLMPTLTENARELLRRLLEARGHGFFLDMLAVLLDTYLGMGRDRGSAEELVRRALPALDDRIAGLAGDARVFAEVYSVELERLADALLRSYQHDETVKNLLRNIQSLLGTGLVDLPVGVDDDKISFLDEPGWPGLAAIASRHGAPIVVDLSWAEAGGAEGPVHRVAAVRMLYSLLAWRQAEWSRRRRGLPRMLVFIDEAHQFFPRERNEIAARQVAATVSRLARLGRARGIGMVFATHSPGDLNDIVFQLANTKILMRMETGQLERLDVPSGYRHFLALAPPRSFLVRSYVYPEGLVSGVTTYPLTAHYDLSAP